MMMLRADSDILSMSSIRMNDSYIYIRKGPVIRAFLIQDIVGFKSEKSYI